MDLLALALGFSPSSKECCCGILVEGRGRQSLWTSWEVLWMPPGVGEVTAGFLTDSKSGRVPCLCASVPTMVLEAYIEFSTVY